MSNSSSKHSQALTQFYHYAATQSEEAAAAREQQEPVTVTVSDEASAPPPAYGSVFKRVKDAREHSDNKLGFLSALTAIFAGTIGCSICLGIFLAIPISMIAMGAIYLDECPVQRFIPIYLLVAGVFAVWENLLGLVESICQKKDSEHQQSSLSKICKMFESLIGCFMLAWFIAGNVWIYSTYNKFTKEPGDDTYCNPTLYWYAFWLTTVGYILLGVVIVGACVVMCCAFCCAACLGSKQSN